jgi:DNA polymerase-1
MKQKIIIDGKNWICRRFFYQYKKGDIRATLCALIQDFIELRKNYDDAGVIITFDSTPSKKRLELYPEYKGNRKNTMDDEQYAIFKKIIVIFEKLCRILGLTVLSGKGYEADDYIAMITHKLKKTNRITILSTDQDLFQLVDKTVSVNNGKIKVTPSNFANVTGVAKEFFIDYKIIVGDNSDNIPGIKGIGKKTALKYIQNYGSYADICEYLKSKEKITKTEQRFLDFKAYNLFKKLMDLDVMLVDKKLEKEVKQQCNKRLEFDKNKVFKFLCIINGSELFDDICQLKR